MQWKRAAGGRPITDYHRGTTEGEYMVWKRTLEDVVESAWARHHQAARVSNPIARACQEDAQRQQLLAEQAARARQEAAAACARQGANDQRHHEAAARAAEALALVEEHCRHEAVLAAEAEDRRRHEAAAQTAESEALTLVEECRRHEAATQASLSTVSPLADEQSCHEAAARATALAKFALTVRPRAQPHRRTG
jgi:hypothetical protein